ncbi:MAG: glycoside hydrolase, partial [Bacteroidota bacterium]|nr:glycoside hydrolase [Bacteroidota bacterium]
SPYKEAELHFTEWNTSPSSRDPMHDTYQNATYVLNTLKKTGTACNSMSYWTFTDIFEEAGPALTPFHGGFGLLNLQNIKKPTYYAYKFMNELGSTMLKNEDNSSYICTSNQKDVQALIWNYTFTDTGSNFNQGYFIKEQPSTICQNAELEISNMQNGTYRVEIYKVGYHQNDPFTGYLEMGRPAQLTLKQEAEIKKLSTGLPADVDNIVINNGSFKRRIPLRNNDIIFIKLIKKN